MLLHRIVMMPDGRVHEQARVETAGITAAQRGGVADGFDGLRCEAQGQTPWGEFRFLWNGLPSGVAIGTFWLADQMFLCTVLAGGLDPVADARYLADVGVRWAGTDLVRGLMDGRPSPFASLADIPDRPLLVAMLVPVPDPDVYREVRGFDLILAAEFLDRVTAGG